MAEATNVGVKSLLQKSHLYSDGIVADLSACSHVRCCSHRFVFPCHYGVVLGHSSTLYDQLQGPPMI